jgi:hypothetical protein
VSRIVEDQRFALVDLFLVLVCGAVWMLKPELGFWFLCIALLPPVVRALSGMRPFQKTKLDVFVLLFLITAVIGYWASYDPEAAWGKLWRLLIAVLLYYALCAQPKENLGWVSLVFFLVGVGVSLQFFLTYDFIHAPRKLDIVNVIGRWIAESRPSSGWTSPHPNYVAGIAAISIPFGIYPILELANKKQKSIITFGGIFIGLLILLFTIFMATSRGIWMAILAAAGVWLMWRIAPMVRINFQLAKGAWFPSAVLIYLCLIAILLYAGPANLSGSISDDSYGTGTRAELAERGLSLLRDFPITGGGLDSFPGLYSHYILGIPFFNVPNSHNTFLDVAIEQGIAGGLAFLIIYLASVWFAARGVIQSQTRELQLFNQMILFALVIAVVHGLVDDYLYNGNGAMLAFFLAGVSVMPKHDEKPAARPASKRWDRQTVILITLIGISLTALLFLNRIFSVWYANLGAVQMAKTELADFPNAGWHGIEIVPLLQQADASLHSSLKSDPESLTANHRLGLVSMLHQDFSQAVAYLEVAHQQAIHHRGITKALGYCYVWLGEWDKAQALLTDIPEAKEELDVYTWWWENQGRKDLSARAVEMINRMELFTVQP